MFDALLTQLAAAPPSGRAERAAAPTESDEPFDELLGALLSTADTVTDDGETLAVDAEVGQPQGLIDTLLRALDAPAAPDTPDTNAVAQLTRLLEATADGSPSALGGGEPGDGGRQGTPTARLAATVAAALQAAGAPAEDGDAGEDSGLDRIRSAAAAVATHTGTRSEGTLFSTDELVELVRAAAQANVEAGDDAASTGGRATATEAPAGPAALWALVAEHDDLDPAVLRALAAQLPQPPAGLAAGATSNAAAAGDNAQQTPPSHASNASANLTASDETAAEERPAAPPRPAEAGALRLTEPRASASQEDGGRPRDSANPEGVARAGANPAPEPSAVRPAAASSPDGARAAAAVPTRILDAVETLRAGPPPERVTVDLSDLARADEPLKVTVTMRGGGVALLAANPQTAALLANWNDDLSSALAQRGLTLAADDGDSGGPGDGQHSGRPAGDSPAPPDEDALAAARPHGLPDPDDRSVWL